MTTSSRGTLALLLRASHPAPALAVTVIVSTLAWRTGWEGRSLVVFALAMLSGQLSVGWSNDAHDASTDRAAARQDKPVVANALSVALLWRSAGVALIVAVGASLAAAGAAGLFHVLALTTAWAYNLKLSRTAWSWLPYAIAFGLLPLFITYGLDPGSAPTWWSVFVFAAMGVAAHLANAARDAQSDAQYGHRSAAISLGPRRTRLLSLGLLLLGTAVLVWQLWDGSPIEAMLIAIASLGATVIAYVRPTVLFISMLLLAVIDVALLLTADLSIVS